MTWQEFIQQEQNEAYFKALQSKLDSLYLSKKIYPKKELIYKAFDLTPLSDVKVVILGQDPYHQEGQAQGLAFSTPSMIKNPPSMVNILKEVIEDYGLSQCANGDLTMWAKQGVLLLNTILTVEDSKPKSHHKMGWEIFTDRVIELISQQCEGVVFILWGANAIEKKKLIDKTRHKILEGPHPSPLSAYRGFFGCKHFSLTNEYLKQNNKEPISW